MGKKNREGLTDRAQAFIREYPKDYNGTQAAIRAGYSPKAARNEAQRLLNYPAIQAALAALVKRAEDETIATVQERARILSQIARGRVGNFVKVTAPGVVGITATEETVNNAALESIEQRTESLEAGGGVITKLKLRNPIEAIAELNKMFGDHAPVRIDNHLTGSIDNMGEEEVDAELAKLEGEGVALAQGKAKTT
jgi:phage terminase small subunit